MNDAVVLKEWQINPQNFSELKPSKCFLMLLELKLCLKTRREVCKYIASAKFKLILTILRLDLDVADLSLKPHSDTLDIFLAVQSQ